MRLKLLAKYSRREGVPLSDRLSHARALARRPYAPGVHGPSGGGRQTDYGKQLREKQKAKRLYGLNERQFRNLFQESVKAKGDSSETLVQFLERRLDNAVYRAGFVKTRAAARQTVSHAHFDVNGKKVNIPSYRVRPGEIISVRENKKGKGVWKGVEETLTKKTLPSWLSLTPKDLSAKVTGFPGGTDLQQPFDAKLIVEFYRNLFLFRMEPILLPSKIHFARGEHPNEGTLTVEPCAQGYGTTLGNALRRVLLSSLQGAAVTAVKIKGADHEFSTLPHVKEDVLDIILNLKGLRMKLFSEEPVKISLAVKGEKTVTGKDFKKDAQVEIVNPERVIATLTDPSASFELDAWIGPGRGYHATEERGKEKLELGTIAIDALYSPVLNVSYKVEQTRVGEKTDFDKLILRVETDGSLDPLDAIKQAIGMLMDFVRVLQDLTSEEAAA